ncbi:MAG: hypothetical protein DMF72_18525 [Acidobacteria bacterium]|nr:MAG: hypothetical protein DMF72_18525 [Acidobacteriota bacterium]
MLNRRALAIGLIATLLCLPIFAQTQSDKDLLERIRKEEHAGETAITPLKCGRSVCQSASS